MIQSYNDDEQNATPPFFKDWAPIYWLVVANITIIIFVLYLLSNHFG